MMIKILKYGFRYQNKNIKYKKALNKSLILSFFCARNIKNNNLVIVIIKLGPMELVKLI